MDLGELIKEKQLTKYRLAKMSGVSKTTISKICSGEADIKNCKGKTHYKLAKALDVSIEELLKKAMEHRPAFQTFKGNICHYVKDMGDINFLTEGIKSDWINYYMGKEWYLEALYLLGMVDYLCRENGLPRFEQYERLRKLKFDGIIWPNDIVLLCVVLKNDEPKERALKEAIPEFLRHNIVEADIRNVA